VQQSQRDYYLREQLKAIQKELGEQDEGQRETDELRQKIEAAGMPEEVKKEALKELARLARMSPMAADYSLTRNYIDWLAILPWAKSSGSKIAATLSQDGNPEIYLLSAAGAILKRLTDSPFIDSSPSWSPDGGQIAFVSSRSAAGGLNLAPFSYFTAVSSAPPLVGIANVQC